MRFVEVLSRARRARLRRAAPFAAFALLPSCRAGLYLESAHLSVGADRAVFAEAERNPPSLGEDDLGALLARFGPPTRVARRRGDLVLEWKAVDRSRLSYGVGVGFAGVSLQLFDRTRVDERVPRVLVTLRDGVVTGFGSSPP